MKKPPGKPPSERFKAGPPPDDMPVGAIWPKMGDPDFRDHLNSADVIFGVYPDGKETLFFGKATLERIVKSGVSKPCLVLRVPIDPTTNDIEALYAYCETIKGSCCYDAKGDDPGAINASLN